MNKEELLQIMKLMFDVMASDDFTDAVAGFCWNMKIKLVAKGFTEDQAMKIVVGMSKANNK